MKMPSRKNKKDNGKKKKDHFLCHIKNNDYICKNV